MNLARVSLTYVLLASSIGFAIACSSNEAAEPVDVDAGVDAAPPPPSPQPDADVPDTQRGDVKPSARLGVTCKQEPCYVAVSGNGSEHVCGLLKDGTVRCWGRDSRVRAEPLDDGGMAEADGALGRGRIVSMIEGATPAPVIGLSGVTQISVGPNLGTCARTEDGAVYCWGRNEFGQLGRPSSQPRLPTPTRVEGLPPVSMVALGASTGCAVATGEGTLFCWGATGTHVGAAAANDAADTFPPQAMPGFHPGIRELSIGTTPNVWGAPFRDTVVTVADGDVLMSLGDFPGGETAFDIDRPYSPLPYEKSSVVRAGAFGYLSKSGLLSRWLPSDRLLYVPSGETVVDIAIAAGREMAPPLPGEFAGRPYVEQAGLLLASGRLYRWGRNTAGALGYPPEQIDLAEEPLDMTHVAREGVVSFATTLASTCVSLVDGTVKCWGTNQRGELGRGTVDSERHPEAEQIR